jgi:hypothetical protein
MSFDRWGSVCSSPHVAWKRNQLLRHEFRTVPSAFWALLPSVARNLNKSSGRLWFAARPFWSGAILGAVALQRARAILSVEALLTTATAIFGGVVLATGTLTSLLLLCVLMSLGGDATR